MVFGFPQSVSCPLAVTFQMRAVLPSPRHRHRRRCRRAIFGMCMEHQNCACALSPVLVSGIQWFCNDCTIIAQLLCMHWFSSMSVPVPIPVVCVCQCSSQILVPFHDTYIGSATGVGKC